MTNKEIIRAEIERRIESLKEDAIIPDVSAILYELRSLLSFIDSLPDESETKNKS